MNGDISAHCKLEFHRDCPWGPCNCGCHEFADWIADAAEWDRADLEQIMAERP